MNGEDRQIINQIILMGLGLGLALFDNNISLAAIMLFVWGFLLGLNQQ